MRNRGGRRSAAALAIVPINAALHRVEPPVELSEAAAKKWREITATMPADWFRPDNWALLTTLCRVLEQADETAEMLDDMRKKGQQRTEDFLKLQQLQLNQSSRIMALMTKMRLTQQSTYDRTTAKKLNTPDLADAPWK